MSLTRKGHAALKEKFISILRDTKREGVEDLIKYLESTDFFKAPARTEHGCAYPGGLLEYSLDVYDVMLNKLAKDGVWNGLMADPEVTRDTIAIVSLLHALYKIGRFETVSVNRKNYDPKVVQAASSYEVKKDREGSFVWESVPGYRYGASSPFGDGELSAMTAMKYIRLTDQELYVIGCHKGYSDCDRASSVSNVFGRYPLAIALYEATLEATFVVEKDKLR